MKFLLFDIDGTQLEMWPIHEKAYTDTIKELYKVPNVNFRDHYTPGDSNEDIVRSNLSALGYSKDFIESRINEVRPAIIKHYLEAITPDAIKVLVGVRKLLTEFKKDEDIILGVVTGNTAAVANKILETADLSKYFAFIVGTEEGNDRETRFRKAIEKAEVLAHVKFGSGEIFYFDDSRASVDPARRLKIISIAVATGETSYEKLDSAEPNYLLHDLKRTDDIVKIVEGNQKPRRLLKAA